MNHGLSPAHPRGALLVEVGFVRFAGSQTIAYDAAKKRYVEEPSTALRHEAYPGATIAALTAKVPKIFDSAPGSPLAGLTSQDLVVVLVGGNDGGLSAEALRDATAALVSSIASKTPARILLLEHPIFLPSELRANALEASSFGSFVAPFPPTRIARGFLLRYLGEKISDVTDDGTHPNDRGYDLLGDDIAVAIARLSPSLSPGATIVILGDSISVGYPTRHGFREILAKKLGISTAPSPPSPPPSPLPPSPPLPPSLELAPHEGLSGLAIPFRWRSLPSGATLIAPSSAGAPDVLLVLPKAEGTVFYQNVVKPWRPLAEREGARAGVPPAEILGTMNGESGGDPHARSSLGALGLMQLYDPSLKKGYTDEELLDPALNVEIGTRALAQIRARVDPKGDVPKTTASYNFGHVERPESKGCKPVDLPWDLCAAPGYVSKVVMSTNTFLHREGKVSYVPGNFPPSPPARRTRASDASFTRAGIVVATVGVALVGGRALLRVIQRG